MPSGASWSGTTFPSHGNQRPGDLNSSRARSRWDTERAIKASNYNGLVTQSRQGFTHSATGLIVTAALLVSNRLKQRFRRHNCRTSALKCNTGGVYDAARWIRNPKRFGCRVNRFTNLVRGRRLRSEGSWTSHNGSVNFLGAETIFWGDGTEIVYQMVDGKLRRKL